MAGKGSRDARSAAGDAAIGPRWREATDPVGRGPTLTLLGLGLATEAVYLLLVALLPWVRYGERLTNWPRLLGRDVATLIGCLTGLIVLAALYALGWSVVRRGGASPRLVWALAVSFALTLFWLLPMTSDLFGYLVHSHLLTDLDANPLLTAPLKFRYDPLVKAFPIGYFRQGTIYGPTWLLLSSVGTLGSQDLINGVAYLKGLAVASYLGSAWLVYRMLRKHHPERALEGLYCFAWNPLVLLLAVGGGHNDMVMMALVLLALWFLLQERWILAFGVLGLSIWVKYVTLLFLPLFALYAWRRWEREAPSGMQRRAWAARRAVGPAAAFLGVSVLVMAPFWRPDLPLKVAERLLAPANWQWAPAELATQLLLVGLGAYALAMVGLLRRLSRGKVTFGRLANASFFASLLAFVLLAARSQPWYLIAPISLASLSEEKWPRPLAGGLGLVMLVVQVWVEWGMPGAT